MIVMQTTIKERLNELFKSQNLSQREFARRINTEVATLNNYLTGRREKINSEFLTSILSAFDNISAHWLLTGEGSMYRDTTNVDTERIEKLHNPPYQDKNEDYTVPLYDINAAANLKTIFDNRNQHIIGRFVFSNMPKCDGVISVKGDSMNPVLKSGDMVAYKMITPAIDDILFGEMYVIDLEVAGETQVVVKYVQHSALGDTHVKLASHNQEYYPKDVALSSIRAMALVKFSIRQHI